MPKHWIASIFFSILLSHHIWCQFASNISHHQTNVLIRKRLKLQCACLKDFLCIISVSFYYLHRILKELFSHVLPNPDKPNSTEILRTCQAIREWSSTTKRFRSKTQITVVKFSLHFSSFSLPWLI